MTNKGKRVPRNDTFRIYPIEIIEVFVGIEIALE
jgi:hypothetical protein